MTEDKIKIKEVRDVNILLPARKVISGGRITIPEDIRLVNDIKEGDMVEIIITKIYKVEEKKKRRKK